MTVSAPDGQSRQGTLPECVPCDVEWVPRHLFELDPQEWGALPAHGKASWTGCAGEADPAPKTEKGLLVRG
ncbi:hypothetical protein GCM10010176_105320 [Nonomuraea spiralis]|nr:hypothetical protein GCM10010176_105320 [Nonomuraea spiralis]